jgi:hypothetical protein
LWCMVVCCCVHVCAGQKAGSAALSWPEGWWQQHPAQRRCSWSVCALCVWHPCGQISLLPLLCRVLPYLPVAHEAGPCCVCGPQATRCLCRCTCAVLLLSTLLALASMCCYGDDCVIKGEGSGSRVEVSLSGVMPVWVAVAAAALWRVASVQCIQACALCSTAAPCACVTTRCRCVA